jgi:hypothetical protein
MALVAVPALLGFCGMVWLAPGPRVRAISRGETTNAATQAAASRVVAAAPEKPKIPIGVNYALAANGGTITGGNRPEELNDGNDTNYTGGTGFGHTTWGATPPQFFLIALKEPYSIDCIRFLLWDREAERFYRYKMEICPDGKAQAWTVVADRTGPAEQCRSWQTVRFKEQPVKLIRLTGTFNSVNSGFHVVELQASLGLPVGTDTSAPEGMDF